MVNLSSGLIAALYLGGVQGRDRSGRGDHLVPHRRHTITSRLSGPSSSLDTMLLKT